MPAPTEQSSSPRLVSLAPLHMPDEPLPVADDAALLVVSADFALRRVVDSPPELVLAPPSSAAQRIAPAGALVDGVDAPGLRVLEPPSVGSGFRRGVVARRASRTFVAS